MLLVPRGEELLVVTALHAHVNEVVLAVRDGLVHLLALNTQVGQRHHGKLQTLRPVDGGDEHGVVGLLGDAGVALLLLFPLAREPRRELAQPTTAIGREAPGLLHEPHHVGRSLRAAGAGEHDVDEAQLVNDLTHQHRQRHLLRALVQALHGAHGRLHPLGRVNCLAPAVVNWAAAHLPQQQLLI